MKYHIYIISVITLFASCANQKTWTYRPNTYEYSNPKFTQKTVAIPPFQDQRNGDNKNRTLFI